MDIADFIRDQILDKRLHDKRCLVVYDPDGRYHDLCLALASDETRVVDASESSIESRLAALEIFCSLGEQDNAAHRLLVYVPAAVPSERGRMQDPFWIYAVAGAVFPKGDADEYLNLCLLAKPDFATQIRKAFADTPTGPTFGVIDAIGSGTDWPQLRAMLGVVSSYEILTALLTPTQQQMAVLNKGQGWQNEARDFLFQTMSLTLKTKSKTLSAMTDEVWRYLLFSEFAFDLPDPMPEALASVPRAPEEARSFVYNMCDDLRGTVARRGVYEDHALIVERELNLEELCHGITRLGSRDTFAFEERSLLAIIADDIATGHDDAVSQLLRDHERSIWVEQGDNSARWAVMRAAVNLTQRCDDLEQNLPQCAKDTASLLDFYVSGLADADRLHREFECTVSECQELPRVLLDAVDRTRQRYYSLAAKAQEAFARGVVAGGWPVTGRNSTTTTFDRLVAGPLKEAGVRVAYIMVDALRYELGVELQRRLMNEGRVEIEGVCGCVPSITPVGMAALLPGAANDLFLGLQDGQLAPMLGQAYVGSVVDRMAVIARLYGDRFAEADLEDFTKGKAKTPETVHLLVLRSTEIDKPMEAVPDKALGMINAALNRIVTAVRKLRDTGFRRVVIGTDHGFILNTLADLGNVCPKPPGTWVVNAHDRMLLGDGGGNTSTIVMGLSQLGMHGAFAQAAFPRTFVPFAAGHTYYHGGVSLQELVVPVITMELTPPTVVSTPRFAVRVSYRNGAKKITTRAPVLDLVLTWDDIFTTPAGVDVLIEAQTAKGEVKGEVRSGPHVNASDHTVHLEPGITTHVALAMDTDYEGKFSVKVLDPVTGTVHDKLDLETDYTV
jgi:hypothetical protein